MNFNFYIFGTPNGYNQYPADNNSSVFQEFVASNNTESQLTIKRSKQMVYYVYMRRFQEKPSSFFGFCLAFNGVYCQNPQKLFELFNSVYYTVQSRGKLLRFDKKKSEFTISNFDKNFHEIERTKKIFEQKVKDDLTQDFIEIPPGFNSGNGQITIDIKENDVDIHDIIAQYEVVHIINTERLFTEPVTNNTSTTKSFSKMNKRLIFYLFIIFLLTLFYKSLNNSTILNLVLPLFTLVSFMYMYGVSGIHHKKFYKPVDYLLPLYISLSASFGLISLIFGIHNDVFAHYDKDKPGSSYNWKWMKVDKILDFPLTQINSDNSAPTLSVNFSNLQKKDTTCHIIVIDKTLSVKSSGEKIDSFLKSKIQETFYVEPSKINNCKTSDLIPPYIFSGLYVNKKDSSSEYVSMWHYTGNTELLFMGYNTDHYLIDIKNEINNEKSNFINNYFDKIEFYKRRNYPANQKTQLDAVIASLNKITKKPEFNSYDSIKVSIISDFINSSSVEGNLDFQSVERLTQLNLYCMNGFDRDNPTCSSFEIIDKATNKFSVEAPTPIIDLTNQKKNLNLFENLSLSNCQYFDHKNEMYLEFFYPYNSFNSKERARAYIYFSETKLGKFDSKKYIFKVIDDENINNTFPVVYKTSSSSKGIVGYAGELVPLNIFKDDTLEISLPYTTSLVNNNRLYLEVSSPVDNKTEAISITLKPRMPNTTSYYLIFCYGLLILSISLLLILPNVFVFHLLLNQKLHFFSKSIDVLNIFLLSLPIALGLFWSILFFTTFDNLEDLNFYLYILLSTLLGFCLPRFFRTYRKCHHNNTDKPYRFHLLGSLVNDALFFISPSSKSTNRPNIK